MSDWIGKAGCSLGDECSTTHCVKEALADAARKDGTVFSFLEDCGGKATDVSLDVYCHSILRQLVDMGMPATPLLITAVTKVSVDAFCLGMIVGRYEASEEAKKGAAK